MDSFVEEVMPKKLEKVLLQGNIVQKNLKSTSKELRR
jgi:hypothetical protein